MACFPVCAPVIKRNKGTDERVRERCTHTHRRVVLRTRARTGILALHSQHCSSFAIGGSRICTCVCPFSSTALVYQTNQPSLRDSHPPPRLQPAAIIAAPIRSAPPTSRSLFFRRLALVIRLAARRVPGVVLVLVGCCMISGSCSWRCSLRSKMGRSFLGEGETYSQQVCPRRS